MYSGERNCLDLWLENEIRNQGEDAEEEDFPVEESAASIFAAKPCESRTRWLFSRLAQHVSELSLWFSMGLHAQSHTGHMTIRLIRRQLRSVKSFKTQCITN